MGVLTFAEKVKLGGGECVMLYRGVSVSGKAFFAYIRAGREGIEHMHQDGLAALTRDIGEYGDVIYMDFRAEPDAKAEAFLAGYLARYEQLLKAAS